MRLFPESLVIASLITSALPLGGKVVTTRKHLKVAPEYRCNADKSTAPYDTLRGSTCGLVRLSGFDKPLRSGKETLFITNHTDRRMSGVILLCRYYDLKGRDLHQRTVTAKCDIPPEATCQVSFKSWDTQGAFYYKLSPNTRKASGAAFDVKISVVALITEPLQPDSIDAH